MKSNLTKII